MFATDDTIVAIATPPGRGGLGVVRISGPHAPDIARTIITRQTPLEPRRATFTRLRAFGASAAQARGAVGASTTQALVGDTLVATYFQAPQSYTGQDTVELSAHGSPVVLRAIVQAAMDAGARLAQPGEFTLRAFLSEKIDLVQAEAVADLIAAATPLQARVAFDQLEGTLTQRITQLDAELFDLIARLEASLDFPDEGYHFIEPAEIAARLDRVIGGLDRLLGDAARGRLIRDGATVVIAGRPNVGKSSLFNALAGADRAIVTSIAGTTRDLITEPVDIEGLAVTLVDTAGAREAGDPIEREGVARGEQARAVADVIVVVLDQSEPLTPDDERLLHHTRDAARVVVRNKSDLPLASAYPEAIAVSATEGRGLDELRCAIAGALAGDETLRDTAMVSNTRHIELLHDARAAIARAAAAARGDATPEEFLLSDLQGARQRFDEVVGTRTSDDVLRHIFERFCIGK